MLHPRKAGFAPALLLTALFGLFASPQAHGQALTATTNEKLPFDHFLVFIDGAAGGAGELIDLSGTLHVQTHVTIDSAGGVHYEEHFQPQNLVGAGMTTGNIYHGVGITRDDFHIKPDGYPYQFSFENNFYMIGTGSAPTLKVHETVHVTINADGTVTTSVDNLRITIK